MCSSPTLPPLIFCFILRSARISWLLVDMKMNKSSLLHLLLLLLAFSLLLSTTAAVPTSRSHKSMKDTSELQDLQAEVMADNGDLLVVEEFAVEGRMDLESTDYPGTGANNRHDPKSPGRF